MHENRFLNPLLRIAALLLALVATTAPSHAEDEFLQPEEAFRISATTDGADAVIVQWDIADGYYLYRSKFRLSSESGGITLNAPVFPRGELKNDEFFGEVEIYRGQVALRVPLVRDGAATQMLNLKAVSQGCADAGLCYPPQTQNLSIRLAADDATPGSPGAALQALGNLGRELGLDDGNDILPPEQAFQFLANVESGDKISLQWKIADGTYLYQDQMRISLADAEGVFLGEFELPPAKIKQGAIRPDGSIGDLPVYLHKIDLPVPLIRTQTEATEVALLVGYQGCAEAGVCYPPIKKQVKLALPAVATASEAPSALAVAQNAVLKAGAAQNTASKPQGPVSETDQITATLAGGNTWLIILSFFGFGLLLALTPCVFPMIPILSGIIAGQGSQITTGRAFSLSLVYVLAMSLTYTAAGVMAGLFGQNLQAAFQNPWILSAFAGIFVLLALSMFGFYELQLPSRWQSKLTDASNHQQGGRFTGVAIMGLLSALIVGPCVAPPLAGALIYIGQTGDALLGGLGLFALSMGMGAPLLLLGASAGKLLPKAGAWMDTIKAVFGVGLLAVAIIMLERILPPAIAMLLWGILMIVSAVYMGALRQLPVEASGWDRLWKGLGFAIMIYGVLMLVGVAAGGKDTVQPLRGLGFAGSGAASHELQFSRIKTVADLQREVSAASAAGRPVMLDFYADWCVSCKEMERYTFSDPAVQSALSGFVLLQADVTADDAEDRALLQGHFGLPGPPSIMFYGRDGKERRDYRVVGFMPADRFAQHVAQAVR